jgi:hypothetical protein
MTNPATEREPSVRRGIVVREEKVLLTFYILYWGPYPAITGVIIEPPQRGGGITPSNKAIKGERTL